MHTINYSQKIRVRSVFSDLAFRFVSFSSHNVF